MTIQLFLMKDAYDIKNIEFGIFSPEKIKSIAVVKINSTKLTGAGSLYDKAMGCITDTNEECATCGLKKECWGHFGYIELPEPILHPMYYKSIVSFLKCFCKKCYRLLLSEQHIEISGLSKIKGEKRFSKILESLEKIDICTHCSSPQPKVMFKPKDMNITMEYKHRKGDGKISIILNVEEIKSIFDNISDDDIRNIGFNPERTHPKNLILTVLPVIPPCSRPYVVADGNTCDDDITYQYLEILKICLQLSPPEGAPVKQVNRQKLIQSLKFRIATTFDNSKGKAKHPTDSRPIKCLKNRLAGKSGRIRNNLMGKRVDFSSRTVIGADPNLKLGQVGIPFEVARILTRPEVVTDFNLKKLKEIVDNNGANFILKKKPDGTISRINLKYAMFRKGTELLYNDIIIRGDCILQEDKNGNVIIPSVEKVEVINIEKTGNYETLIGDLVIYKMKKVIEVETETNYHLTSNSVIVRGCKLSDVVVDGKITLPTPRSAIEIIYVINGNAILMDGDKLIRNGKLIPAEYPSRKNIKLQIGDEVERHLVNGDIVLFNRQPTLHKASMQAMAVVLGDHQTFRFNLSVCKAYNADFDGDEMNLHAPQSLEAIAELEMLSAAKYNIISAQESKPIITIVQDSLLSAYLMTMKDFKLTRTQFENISSKGSRLDDLPMWNPEKIKTIQSVLKKFGKNTDFFNGRGLISLTLPSDLYYEVKNNTNPDEPIVKIYNGVLVEGAFDKTIIGSSHSSLIQVINKEYGVEVATNFIDNIQFICNAWIRTHGFSIGLEDCMITSQESVLAIKDTLVQCYTKAQGIEENTQNAGIREVRVTAALSQAKDIGMRIAKNAMKKDNNFLATVHSGAKGDFFNIAQITGILGQQNLEGHRVIPVLNHGKRTLPHYPFELMSKEREYQSKGFVSNSFIHGLTPEEFYFHAMSGREGISDTAMGTAKSGYTQRKIVKICEDIQVKYDGTVRDATGKIYQFAYGGNGLDPTQTVKVDGQQQVCDIRRLVNRLNKKFEQTPQAERQSKFRVDSEDSEDENKSESESESESESDNESKNTDDYEESADIEDEEEGEGSEDEDEEGEESDDEESEDDDFDDFEGEDEEDEDNNENSDAGSDEEMEEDSGVDDVEEDFANDDN